LFDIVITYNGKYKRVLQQTAREKSPRGPQVKYSAAAGTVSSFHYPELLIAGNYETADTWRARGNYVYRKRHLETDLAIN